VGGLGVAFGGLEGRRETALPEGTGQAILELAVARAVLPKKGGIHKMHHWKIRQALLAYRTPALGGHRYQCQQCQRTDFVPHSCRNRHCPLYQEQAARTRFEQKQAALLPVPCFHLFFTLPHELNPLIRQNQRVLYAAGAAALLPD
jgi:hypothetical protein